MNIVEFRDMVHDRIVLQYMKDVRNTKPSGKDWLIFFARFFIPIIIFMASFYLYNPNGSLFLMGLLGAFMYLSALMLIPICFISLLGLKNLLFFKNGSNKFWKTNLFSKSLLSNESLINHLAKYDELYCRKNYSSNEKEVLTQFTIEEVELMKNIHLNNPQKEALYEIVKSGREINFYDLDELIDKSDEYMDKKNLLKKENKNQLILESFKCAKELEMEMGSSLNQKIKQLL